MWERVSTKLRFRLVSESAVFMHDGIHADLLEAKHPDQYGRGLGSFFRTFKDVSVKNDQRDVEGGVSELLMH
jgi:hypothetical protein